MSNAGILASRRNGDVLIADEPTLVEVVWTDVPTSDGEQLTITWLASVACVDSSADRAMLAERYLTNGASTLVVTRVAADLAAATASAVRATTASKAADVLLSGLVDDELQATIERETKGAAFATGLAILPPYRLTVTSPLREQARRLAETRERLALIAKNDQGRAQSLADATRAMTEAAGDPERARRALSMVRLADPLDLLRATAIVEPSWSAATPSLWIAAGTRLAHVDLTHDVIDPADAPSIGDSLGPIRSVCAAAIDGDDVLLLGMRDGVHAVLRNRPGKIVRSFRHAAAGDFGFNSACFVERDRQIVATHSAAGIVCWSWENADAVPAVHAVGKARSAVAIDDSTVALIVNGSLATFSSSAGISPFAGNVRLMSVRRNAKLIREDLVGTDTLRYSPPSGIEDELDVGGVPRTVRALSAGGLELIDVAGAMPLPIGPRTLGARSVAARPGFVAAVSTDRTRVSLIALSKPDTIAAELHVAIALGSRIADVCFA